LEIGKTLLEGAVAGFVEGLVVVILTAVALPIILKDQADVSSCVNMVNQCIRSGCQAALEKRRGGSGHQAFNDMVYFREELGEQLQHCFGNRPSYDSTTRVQLFQFSHTLSYADPEYQMPADIDAYVEIRAKGMRLKRHIETMAAKNPLWILRAAVTGDHH